MYTQLKPGDCTESYCLVCSNRKMLIISQLPGFTRRIRPNSCGVWRHRFVSPRAWTVKDAIDRRLGRSSEIKQNAPNGLMLSGYVLLLKMLSFVTARCTCGRCHPRSVREGCGFGLSERSGTPAAGGVSPRQRRAGIRNAGRGIDQRPLWRLENVRQLRHYVTGCGSRTNLYKCARPGCRRECKDIL
jgi:hypothetical protein